MILYSDRGEEFLLDKGGSDQEWTDASACVCDDCDHGATVREFTEEKVQEPRPPRFHKDDPIGQLQAARLAEKASVADLITMFSRARALIQNWRSPSRINPALSRGAMFNILTRLDPVRLGPIGKMNAIREFGCFLPQYVPIPERERQIVHMDPIEYPRQPIRKEIAVVNRRMKEMIDSGEAIDVETIGTRSQTDPSVWVLNTYVDDKDYCVASTERWIWSIGKHKESGQILASMDSRFYQNPDFECLWLR